MKRLATKLAVLTFALFPILLFLTLVLTSPRAHAQEPTPSLVAPPISFCIGQTFTCVTPDLNASFANYDLRDKKWSGGVSTIGVGYSLLFASDQPYASGFALHAAGNFAQATPSYLSVIPTVVLMKYFEAGVNVAFLDGDVKYYFTVGLSGNFEILKTLLTGKNIGERYQTALAAYRAKQEVTSP
jgi:hypothetical protein